MPPFLCDEQFERLYVLLQGEPKIHTKERVRERLFLDALCWLVRSGAQWRFLPTHYGAWNSVYKRFARWDDWVSGIACSRAWPTTPICRA